MTTQFGSKPNECLSHFFLFGDLNFASFDTKYSKTITCKVNAKTARCNTILALGDVFSVLIMRGPHFVFCIRHYM